MTVYVFVHQLVCDAFDYGIEDTNVFDSWDKAIAALKQWRDEELKYVKDRQWEINVDLDTAFEAYKYEDWTDNHCCGYIKEVEVQ